LSTKLVLLPVTDSEWLLGFSQSDLRLKLRIQFSKLAKAKEDLDVIVKSGAEETEQSGKKYFKERVEAGKLTATLTAAS